VDEVTQGTPQSPDAGAATADGVFLRKASGVVRTWRSRDGMYYGYLSAAGLYCIALIGFLGAAIFPNANVLIANIIPLLCFVVVHAVYANLASGMPRSGGDYVFVSRLLHSSVGYMITWGIWVAWAFFWQYLAGSTIVTAAISPALSAIGVATGNDWFTNAADKVQLWYIKIPISLALCLLATWILVMSAGAFLAIMRKVLIPLSALGVAIIGLSFIFIPSSTAFKHFDDFQAKVSGLPAGKVISTASDLGFAPTHSVWFDTLGLATLIGMYYVWTLWQSALLGEIKQANQLKTTFWMYDGASIMQFVTLFVVQVGAYWYFGQHWFTSFSWLALNQPDALGGAWSMRGWTTMMYLPSYNIWIGLLLFLCFMAPMSNSLFNNPLSCSRYLLAMAFDRVLPKWLGGVNKNGIPTNAIWFCFIMTVVVGILIELAPSLSQLLLWTSFATYIGVGASLLAGLVFPSRGKAIFDVSPGKEWRVLGMPGVVPSAVLALAYVVASMIIMIAHDSFGLLLAGPARVGLWAMIVALIVPFVAFWIIRSLRRREGIEVDYAFKTIPRA
jgi:amino acid transporter